MSVQLTRHRFTWDDYHAMVSAGALRDDDRVELIEGEIVDMTPIGSRHGAAVDLLNLCSRSCHGMTSIATRRRRPTTCCC